MRKKVNQAGAFERYFQGCYRTIDLFMEAKNSRKNCLSQLKKIDGGYKGSHESFKNEVLSFWSQYNIKPKKMWYDLYCFSDEKYNPLYIPGDLYWQKIYPALNKVAFRRAYTNKCLYDTLFPYLKKPKTILYNINGTYFNGERRPVHFSDAIRILKDSEAYVLKPALYSGGGKDIYFYTAGKNDDFIDQDVDSLLRRYRSDFIVQELVEQHKTLSAIHPESVNTIRTITFLFGGQVHISSSILRMGTSGSRMDNYSVGGIACPIGEDGRLREFAVNTKTKWISCHPSGALFKAIQVPAYGRILDLVKEAHLDVPFFRIIGWDFAIDKNGDPVFIEYNGAPDLNQLSCGPLFGELTETILDFIFGGKDEPDLYPLEESILEKLKLA